MSASRDEVIDIFNQLMNAVDWEVDNEGQVMIYTGCKLVDGKLVPINDL